MYPSTLAKRGTVLLFLAFIAFYFYGLGQLPLLGPDEPRYAQVAREMFLRHDLITPTLGSHLWFEKPALLYWMMIASFKLFGVSEWSARLPAAISGLLTVAAVFCVGKRFEETSANERLRDQRVDGSEGFWSVLATGTTIGIVVFSRGASFDILLTMTTTWSLAFYALYAFEENALYPTKANEKKIQMLLAGFYVFIGLSLLAKGLVGIIIPTGVVGLYYLFARRLPERRLFTSLIWGLPLALIVAATWYAPVIWRHGWTFVDQFFIQHHFARYVSNKYRHGQPVYYYLLILPLLTLPWTVFIIGGLLESKRWLVSGSLMIFDRAEGALIRLKIFALAWLLFPLVFFSFSNSKLPGYLLPTLPAAALIAGERLWRFHSDYEADTRPMRIHGAFCLLLAIGVGGYAWRANDLPVACAVLIAACLLAAAFAAFRCYPGETLLMLVTPAATLIIVVVGMHCLAPRAAELDSSKHLLQLADARGYSQTAIYGMQRSDRSPEFYAAGRVVYDAAGEPIMYEGVGQIVWESNQRRATILAMVPVDDVNQLTQTTSVKVDVIGNNGRFALVAVGPR